MLAARGWRGGRAGHATETPGECVEGVSDSIHRRGEWRVKNRALHMGVSHVTVVRTIARLARGSLVVSEPYRPVRLSAKGERLAANSRNRHEIVLSFLLALGVRPVEAARDAEGMEHHVSADTLKRMKAFIAQASERPKRSPASKKRSAATTRAHGASR